MEKTLYNQVGEVKGASSETEDSFSFQFTPQNENLKRTRGSLFTLISISGKVDDRFDKAKNIYHQFQSSYYAKASGSILHGLSDTLEQLVKNNLKTEEETGVQVSLIAAVFWGTVVYLSKHGTGDVFVARADKVKKLEFAKVASGVLEDQDTVCLASAKFVEKVSLEELVEALTQEKFEETLKILDQKIEKVAGAVCDVIRLSVNAPEEESQPLAITPIDEDGKPESEVLPEEVKEEVLENEPLAAVAEPTRPETAIPATADPFEQEEVKKPSQLKRLIPKIQGLFVGIGAKIAQPWRKPLPGEHFDPVAIRRTRIIQIVGLLLVLFIVSVGFGVISKGSEEKVSQVNELMVKVEKNLTEASNIKVIDPTRALALVDQAQKDLAVLKENDSDNAKIKELENRSSDLEAEITKTTIVKNPEVVFDLTKLSKETSISDIAFLNDQILLLDSSRGSLFSLPLDSKNALNVPGIEAAQTITSLNTGFYLTTANGINKIDSALKVTSIGNNSNWGKIISSATYQNNLYLLDTEKNEIWRYLSSSVGLGSGRAYISGEKPDMSQAVAIAIDGQVWVATKTGNIYKFSAGKKQSDFTIIGLADYIGELSDMYTASTTKNHYFLDKGKGRIIATDKTGIYQAAYAQDQLHKAESLIVDEENKVVYFTAEAKLYKFPLP